MPAGCLLSPFQISDVSDSVRGVNTAGTRVLEISIDGNGQYGRLVVCHTRHGSNRPLKRLFYCCYQDPRGFGRISQIDKTLSRPFIS